MVAFAKRLSHNSLEKEGIATTSAGARYNHEIPIRI